jgi:hypothetical protein
MQGRTTASGPLLRSAGLREYEALGSIGRPVIETAPQLRATLRRQLGEDVAAMLAVPQINESGDAGGWYAPAGALVVPWSAATPEEREAMRGQLQAARLRVLDHGAALAERLRERPAGAVADDFEVYARLLPHVMRIPDDSHIYAVDGKPVLTFWGFADPRAPQADPIRDLMPAAAPVAAPVSPGVAAAVPAAARSWRWLWWLLLPLLGLLLLLFALRACEPALLPEGLRPALPDVSLPGVEGRGGVAVPAVPVVPGVGGSSVTVPVVPGGAGGADAGAASVVPDAATPPQAEESTSDPAAPPPQENPSSATPPQPETPSAPQAEEKNAATPPRPEMQEPGKDTPLAIPPQAAASNDPSFLNGKWKSNSGLMDDRTGLPVVVEHDFKNGKGKTTIRRGDGTVCVGNSTATMQGGKLVIVGDDDPACSDGSRYGRARVECRQGKDGKAVCSGKQANGPDYSVDMRR